MKFTLKILSQHSNLQIIFEMQRADQARYVVGDSSKNLIREIVPDSIDIVFHNISYSVKIADDAYKSKIPCNRRTKEKTILQNVSGIFKAGKVNSIMGASGAGKTTLLNVLACRINPGQGGKLYANNLQYNYNNFGDFANYVMQADVLMQTLTVRETLQFAAQLKLNLNLKQRKQKVFQMASHLQLQKCLDTMVGGVIIKGISGGEKKRTSIAFQLISDPQVIFLDQPTSGLDSLTSYIIVSQLRTLAHKMNRTVIMTIHQPNSQIYALFDNLTLLLQGKIIYQAGASDAREYFSVNFNLTCPTFANTPDFFMSKIHYQDIKNRERYNEFFSTYQRLQQNKVQKMIEQKQTTKISFREVNVGMRNAMGALLHRASLNTLRNPMLIKSKLIQGIFMSLFIGGLYFDIGTKDYTQRPYWLSITGFLFFLTILSLMGAISPVVLTFPVERQVFFKEQDSKMYSVGQYFLARNLIQLPQLVLIPLINVCIFYFMVDLSNTAGQFFLFFLIFCLMAFTGSSMGLLLGSVVLDSKSVSSLMPVVLLPVILFSGFYKNRDDLPPWIGWIQYISPNKYGFIAFVSNQVANKASRINDLNFDVEKWAAIGILFSLGIFFRLLSLFFLWLLRKKSQ